MAATTQVTECVMVLEKQDLAWGMVVVEYLVLRKAAYCHKPRVCRHCSIGPS